MRYKVWVFLNGEYDIEADCEEEATEIAKEMVMEDGDCWYRIETAERSEE